jgi:hypothetical protein
MMTNRSQHIEHFAILLRCRAYPVGSHNGHLQAGCHRQQCLIARFFIAQLMALQFNEKISASVDCDKPFRSLARLIRPTFGKSSRKWSFIAAGQADQSG